MVRDHIEPRGGGNWDSGALVAVSWGVEPQEEGLDALDRAGEWSGDHLETGRAIPVVRPHGGQQTTLTAELLS